MLNDGFVPEGFELADPAARARTLARRAYGMGEFDEASRQWLTQGDGPQGPMDLTVLAEIFAAGGNALARQSLDALRAVQPAEAEAIEARARYVAGDRAGATQRLVTAFTMYQRDPWPHREPFTRALELARRIASEDSVAGGQLFEALTLPFAVRALDMPRLWARAVIGLRDGSGPQCVAGLAPLEPHVPWEREFLEKRAECYGRSGSPLAGQARTDLEAFRAAAR